MKKVMIMINNSNLILKNILSAIQTAPTLTAVAKWLYTSQPNISKTISDAEQKYKTKLVNRSKIPISLTPAGEELLIRLEQILNLEEETIRDIQNYSKNNQRKVSLAFFPTYASIILPKIFSPLLQQHPNLALDTQSLTTSEALNALKDGQISIFLGRNVSDPRIKSLSLFTEKLCFVISNKSPLYDKKNIEREIKNTDLIALQKENYISWKEETSFIDVTNHFFLLNGLKFNGNLNVANYEEAMLCAAQGLGITMAMYKTAKFFLKDNKDINLLIIPEKMASLEISTMVLKNATPYTIQIAHDIAQLFIPNKKLLP